jgi:hypothetical protein
MPYELPKSQKKIARQIIETGLQREYQSGIEKADAVIEKWKSGKMDNQKAYISIYRKLISHDKHLARRYDNMSGSKYLMIISGQVADGIVSFDELSELNNEAREVVKNWLGIIEGD